MAVGDRGESEKSPRRKQLPMGSCSSKEIEGGTRKLQHDANRQAALLRQQAEADALKAAQDEEQRAKAARVKEFTVVLLDLNGNPGETLQLKRDLHEHSCKLSKMTSADSTRCQTVGTASICVVLTWCFPFVPYLPCSTQGKSFGFAFAIW